MMEQDSSQVLNKLEKGTNQLFRVVFERLDNLEETLPAHSRDRIKIGIKSSLKVAS